MSFSTVFWSFCNGLCCDWGRRNGNGGWGFGLGLGDTIRQICLVMNVLIVPTQQIVTL